MTGPRMTASASFDLRMPPRERYCHDMPSAASAISTPAPGVIVVRRRRSRRLLINQRGRRL
ncbi:hypothetical protein AB0269_12055 [Microbacterium sp. NPDC077644]|uniref:hypothetical protein n=1 Tax=Microbacterium sp. NPDC077644 TaxID=3155055 RepID=UPI00344D1334